MKNTAHQVAKYELEIKLGAIKSLIESAENCLESGDLFQCAVRLEMIEPYKFEESFMKVLEALSKEK